MTVGASVVGGSAESPQRGARRWRITREGWVCVGAIGWAAFAAVSSNSSLMLLICCLIGALFVLGLVLPGRVLRRVRVQRRLPEFAVAGRAATIEFELHNEKWFASAPAVAVQHAARSAAAPAIPPLYVDTVRPRRTTTARQEVVFPARGSYRFEAPELTTRYPFGFLERRVSAGTPHSDELIVYPRLGKLTARFFEMEQETHPEQVGRQPDRSSQADDYHGLRDFRYGDSPRWIHWPTTARRGTLMVKEFEVRRNRDVVLFLDPWQPERPDPRHTALFELGISLAATLCVELCKQPGLHLLLGVASDPPVMLHGQSSSRLARQLLERLAVLSSTPEPAWSKLMGQLPPAWIGQGAATLISARPLDVVLRDVPRTKGGRRRWERLARQMVYVDVGSSSLDARFRLE